MKRKNPSNCILPNSGIVNAPSFSSNHIESFPSVKNPIQLFLIDLYGSIQQKKFRCIFNFHYIPLNSTHIQIYFQLEKKKYKEEERYFDTFIRPREMEL
jgi:hypothetical protein